MSDRKTSLSSRLWQLFLLIVMLRSPVIHTDILVNPSCCNIFQLPLLDSRYSDRL
jgi:hypothetical protein